MGGRLGWAEGEELGPGKEAGRLGREVGCGRGLDWAEVGLGLG